MIGSTDDETPDNMQTDQDSGPAGAAPDDSGGLLGRWRRRRGEKRQDKSKDEGKRADDTGKRPLRERLSKTRTALSGQLAGLSRVRRRLDDELMEEIEDALLTADVGVEATRSIVDELTRRVKRKELGDAGALLDALRQQLTEVLAPCEAPLALDPDKRPYVILMVGVNGVGKTTAIGKLAHRFIGEGRSVVLAAGDTFRAAAVEQLQAWGERTGVPVVAQQTGADAASVVFDALQAAQARHADVLIADTAGRLHTQSNLMEELRKIKRVLGKRDASAPHEVMLVIDGGTGQNALAQAREFHQAVGVTGMTVTKLDGTAKGGILFALAQELALPVRFVGVGEGAEDLRPFAAADFVDALLPESLDPAQA